MSAGLLIVLGVLLLAAGAYSFMNRDQVWEGQVRANEAKGLVSERSGAWDIGQSFKAMTALVLGVVVLGAGLVTLTKPQRPIGSYGCFSNTESAFAMVRTTLILGNGGQGSYEDQPLTWAYDTKTVTFTGDTKFVSGQFDRFDPKTFMLTDRSGKTLVCWLR